MSGLGISVQMLEQAGVRSRDKSRTFSGIIFSRDEFGMLRATVYRLGDFVLDERHLELLRDGQRLNLTRKPWLILIYLVENRDRVVPRQELLDRFWGGKDVYEQTLTRTVTRIRRVLGDTREQPCYIETRWAIGYRYVGPCEFLKEAGSIAGTIEAEAASVAEPAVQPEPAPTTALLSSAPGRSPGVWRLTALTLVVVACLGAAAGWLSTVNSHRIRAGKTSARNAAVGTVRETVAVFPFRDLGAGQQNGWLGTALAEMISTELAADGRVRVLPGDAVARVDKELQLNRSSALPASVLAAVNRDAYADVVVTGSYLVLDPRQDSRTQVRIDMVAQDAKTREPIVAFSETGWYDELFHMAAACGSKVLASMKLAGSPAPSGDLPALAPGSPDVMREYIAGLDSARDEDLIAAVKHLQMAVHREPSFSMAHFALAEVWDRRGYQDNARAEFRLAAASSAGLDREHRLMIDARYAAAVNNWNQAISEYQALFTFFPDNVDYGLALANAFTEAGRPADSERTLRMLQGLHSPASQDPRIDIAAASAAQARSDFAAAARHTRAAMDRAKRSGAVLLYANALSMHAGSLANTDVRAAIRESEEARNICAQYHDPECEANILRRLGIFEVDSNSEAAAADLREALRIAQKIGNRREEDNDLNGLAAILSDDGDYQTADDIYRQLIQHATESNSGWGLQMALNNLGDDLLAEGHPDAALAAQEKALAISRHIGLRQAAGYALVSLAHIHLAEGDLNQAKNEIEEAIATFSEIQDTGMRALALSTLGSVERERGNLGMARKDQQEALEYLTRVRRQGDAGDAEVEMARTSLESNQPQAAVALLSTAETQFAKEKRPASEASAWALLALAMMRLRHQERAEAELHRALQLIESSQDETQRMEVEIDHALLVARSSASISDGELRTLNRGMLEVSQQAQASHLTVLAMRALLANAEIEARLGKGEESQQQAQAVITDARRSGCVLVAEDASELRSRLAVQFSPAHATLRDSGSSQ